MYMCTCTNMSWIEATKLHANKVCRSPGKIRKVIFDLSLSMLSWARGGGPLLMCMLPCTPTTHVPSSSL